MYNRFSRINALPQFADLIHYDVLRKIYFDLIVISWKFVLNSVCLEKLRLGSLLPRELLISKDIYYT